MLQASTPVSAEWLDDAGLFTADAANAIVEQIKFAMVTTIKIKFAFKADPSFHFIGDQA